MGKNAGSNVERGQDGTKDIGKVKRAVAPYEEGKAAHTARNATKSNSEGRSFKTIENGHESNSGSKHEELCDTAGKLYRTAVENRGGSDGHGDHGLQNR